MACFLGSPRATKSKARRRRRMGGGAMMPSARGKHPAAALPSALGDRCSHRARRPARSGVVVARSVRGPGGGPAARPAAGSYSAGALDESVRGPCSPIGPARPAAAAACCRRLPPPHPGHLLPCCAASGAASRSPWWAPAAGRRCPSTSSSQPVRLRHALPRSPHSRLVRGEGCEGMREAERPACCWCVHCQATVVGWPLGRRHAPASSWRCARQAQHACSCCAGLQLE